MALPDTREVAKELPESIRFAFQPIDKRALGFAVGVLVAVALFLFAAINVVKGIDDEEFVWILQNYFRGYGPTWTGALAGAFWGFWCGFVMGWFLAFSRNLTVALWVFAVGAKERLAASRDFLDHI